MRSRVYGYVAKLRYHITAKHIHFTYFIYLITEKFYPVCSVTYIRRKDFHYVSPYSKGSTMEVKIISVILYIN